jgi:phenylpropionate dioxygenase-like ring-hydroxylating dioxygenase large terminal subunit
VSNIRDTQRFGSQLSEKTHPSYPRNCWWVAATRDELTDVPLARQLLGGRLVLARTDSGLLALDDRCPHRRAPLSAGRLVDEGIECPYHGIRFNRQGQCTLVPSAPNRTQSLIVRSYPTVESGPFVWIWMGDPEKADSNLIPELKWPSEPTLRVGGYHIVRCSHMALLENFMDLTHVPFVHRNRFSDLHVADQFLEAPTCSTEPYVSEHSVSTATQLKLPATELERHSLGLKMEHMVERTSENTVTLPSCFVQHNRMRILSAHPTPQQYYVHAALCTTPISPNQCHFWWATVQDFGQDIKERWQAACEDGLKDDIDVLENVQRVIDQDFSGTPEILVESDVSVIQMRRVLRRMLLSERS